MLRCRRKFQRYFKHAFRDDTYLAWERDYKWQAHLQWQEALPAPVLARLASNDPMEVARRAVRIESRTNLLFSFEKMALRDAVRTQAGAARFARALHSLLETTVGRRRALMLGVPSLPGCRVARRAS